MFPSAQQSVPVSSANRRSRAARTLHEQSQGAGDQVKAQDIGLAKVTLAHGPALCPPQRPRWLLLGPTPWATMLS